ncbi:MAG: hypothetical protein IJL92_03565 [Thermoguttaceae bacterium]|nr:hypothetical protein [Thermoguttaceae bacterium]
MTLETIGGVLFIVFLIYMTVHVVWPWIALDRGLAEEIARLQEEYKGEIARIEEEYKEEIARIEEEYNIFKNGDKEEKNE